MRALPLAVWVMVCASPANADVFSMFGTSARSQGMAGSVVASSQGHGSVYDNPAGLVHGSPRLTLGMYGNYNRTSIRLMERPTGYTPPGYDRRVNERQDTDEFGSSGGFTLGATLQPWKGRLSLGVSLAMPFAGVANLDTGFTDEREQYFSNQLSFFRAGTLPGVRA